MKVRVKEGNSYGGYGPGEILDLTDEQHGVDDPAREIARVAHCLEPVEAHEQRTAAKAEAEVLRLERGLEAARARLPEASDLRRGPRQLTRQDLEEIEAIMLDAREARAQLADVLEENRRLRDENASLREQLAAKAEASAPKSDLPPPPPASDLEQSATPARPVEDATPKKGKKS